MAVKIGFTDAEVKVVSDLSEESFSKDSFNFVAMDIMAVDCLGIACIKRPSCLFLHFAKSSNSGTVFFVDVDMFCIFFSIFLDADGVIIDADSISTSIGNGVGEEALFLLLSSIEGAMSSKLDKITDACENDVCEDDVDLGDKEEGDENGEARILFEVEVFSTFKLFITFFNI